MKWQKEKLRALIKERGLTHDRLAEEIGVSRQTVASWFAGQVPKGLHLMKLWSMLDLAPGSLFLDDTPHYVTRAMYHTIGAETRQESVRRETEALIARYVGFFTKKDTSPLQHAILSRDAGMAKSLSIVFRKMMGLQDGVLPSLLDILALMAKLDVCVIPRSFPKAISADAFFVTINFKRVIFVDRRCKAFDLAKSLVHESVHAMRPTIAEDADDAEVEKEEKFCEDVVRQTCAGRGAPSEQTLESMMFCMGEVCQFVCFLEKYFPVWYAILKENADSLTASRMAEVLDMPQTDASAFVKCISRDFIL